MPAIHRRDGRVVPGLSPADLACLASAARLAARTPGEVVAIGPLAADMGVGRESARRLAAGLEARGLWPYARPSKGDRPARPDVEDVDESARAAMDARIAEVCGEIRAGWDDGEWAARRRPVEIREVRHPKGVS